MSNAAAAYAPSKVKPELASALTIARTPIPEREMPAAFPTNLHSYLAWRFDAVLPGSFRRNKADFAHHKYPILSPMPKAGRHTAPLETSASGGPYVYFVCDSGGVVHYVGKSLEVHVFYRWVRPGVGGPAKHYWTHSTRSGGVVFEIARGLQSGASEHYDLRYLPSAELSSAYRTEFGVDRQHDAPTSAALAEAGLIRMLRPDWNAR